MKRWPLAACLAAALLSCSIDYGEQLAENLENIPNAILQNFEQVSVRGNRPVFRLQAEIIESYNTRGLDRLQGVEITEYDERGEVLTSGRAAEANINQRSRDGNFKDVRVYSRTQKARIEATDIQWLNEPRQLKSSREGVVRIQREDGLVLEGRGFTADFKMAQMNFESNVSGSYEETKTDATTP